jgi:hypothetical protein
MPELNNATVQPQQVEQPVVAVPTPTPAEVATTEAKVVAQGLETGQQPTALTEQRVLEMIEKRANEIAEKKSLEAVRLAQSMNDKLDARLRKEVEDRLKTVEAVVGQPLTEAQKLILEKQTRAQIIAEQQPQEQPPVQDFKQHPLYPIVEKLSVKYGVTPVNETDPEFITVNVKGDWDDWRETFDRAMKAKASRLAPKQTPSVEQPTGNPQARIPTTPVKGSAGLPDVDANKLFSMAYNKK